MVQHGASVVIKRAVAAVAAAASLAAVSACGGSDSGKTVNGKPVIDVLVQYDSTNRLPIEKNKWVKTLEAACDCSISWQIVQQNAWAQQKSAILTSGDVPDVSIRAFNPDDAAKFPYFENLSPYIDKMPNVKEFFDQNPSAKRMVSDLDGNLEILPAQFPEGGSNQHWMINKAWLDKLGLKMPTTWDELTQVLKAFKEQDPNGNGKADEIPFDVAALGTDGFRWYTPMLALGSTGIVTQAQGGPFQNGIYVKGGKVKEWLTSDELKETLQWYASLFKQKLIPTDALTQDGSKYGSALTGTETAATVGLAFAYQPAAFGSHAKEYAALPTPKANASMSDSDVVWDASGDYGKYENYHLAVKKDDPHMDNIVKLINSLYSEKMSVQQFYGDIPELVTDEGNSSYKVSDKVFADPNVSYSLGGCFAGWFPDNVKIAGDPNLTARKEAESAYQKAYSNYKVNEDSMPIWVKLDNADQTTFSNNNTQILNYAIPLIAKWMNGTESDYAQKWDTYVSQVNKLGLEQNVQLWQKWYDKYSEQKF
ncbi:MAG: extracellular solute-binding protein [Bifidobacterium sp.]|jgi:putative aldouronate transport system substrate-binding protein|nr:extracellular solute-binding protein [Bifidobacterium sp.]